MRTERYVGVVVVVFACMLAPFTGAVADPAVASGDARPVSPKNEPASSSPSGGERTRESGSAESSTKPFIPSESISADSAISFPVDI